MGGGGRGRGGQLSEFRSRVDWSLRMSSGTVFADFPDHTASYSTASLTGSRPSCEYAFLVKRRQLSIQSDQDK